MHCSMSFPKRFTLRVTLLSLITTILVGTVFTLSIYNYVRSSQTALVIAKDLLNEVNGKAVIHIQSMFGPVVALGKRIQELPDLGEKPVLLPTRSRPTSSTPWRRIPISIRFTWVMRTTTSSR